MFELAEEALDEIALAIKALGEAGFPLSISLGGYVWRRALFLDERANAVGVVGLIGQDNDAGSQAVEQLIGDLSVVRLPGRQADPDREPLGVDDDVDFRREAASASTETMIWTPLWMARPSRRGS
jgi:hypothetical protein